MKRPARGRRVLAAVACGLLVVFAGGCGDPDSGQPEQQGELRLEPVSFAGEQPFTPPAGTGREGVEPQVEAGGTVPGDTPGLYGGSLDESSCEVEELTTYLAEDGDRAAAWARVRGIEVDEIGDYLAGLTPVWLLADTAVTNHGFADGEAVPIPAVFQAGTAVLVDELGAPVVKCFCGNPLTALTVPPDVTFIGNPWTNFSTGTVTLIEASVTVVQEFTLVQPGTGEVFTRPQGTDGAADRPGPGATSGTPSPSPGSPSPGSPSPGATGTPTPTPGPGPRGTAPGGSPSPLEPAPAAWVVGGCYLDDQDQPHGVLRVRNEDSVPHTYTVTVEFSDPGGGTQATVTVPEVAPDTTVEQEVPEGGGSAPAVELISCSVTEITDESGARPVQGSTLEPPPDPSLETESPPTTGSPTPEPTPS